MPTLFTLYFFVNLNHIPLSIFVSLYPLFFLVTSLRYYLFFMFSCYSSLLFAIIFFPYWLCEYFLLWALCTGSIPLVVLLWCWTSEWIEFVTERRKWVYQKLVLYDEYNINAIVFILRINLWIFSARSFLAVRSSRIKRNLCFYSCLRKTFFLCKTSVLSMFTLPWGQYKKVSRNKIHLAMSLFQKHLQSILMIWI